MDKSSIHEIVLVGGSTRIPKVRGAIRKNVVSSPFNVVACKSVSCTEPVPTSAACQGLEFQTLQNSLQ